eukprot:TRINITY_DN2163_c0_g1_i1.p1 TRINITY_DN2163_c0_g1~~TRINITY_DN2163_c0_g1_i1.p1  ORF type:complete len:169 (-),score=51.71 TRINITY_DN2163_c0_g1_i1:360-866(-)
MARISAVSVAAAAVVLLNGAAFILPYATSASNKDHKAASAASAMPHVTDSPVATPASSLATFMAAVMVGLLAGLVSYPAMTSAANLRPEFSVVRPDWMQGIDAALAAVKKGEVDFVTRSHMEMASMPEALEELKKEKDVLDNAPSKEVRVKQQLEHLRELAKITPIPA